MQRVLITAFEPFNGETINPSLETARAVDGMDFPDIEVDVIELPVERFQAPDMAIAHIRMTKPDAVLMLGEAGRRSRITPERVAVNLDDFTIPDNGGHQPRDEPIVRGGPVGYFSTLPLAAMVNQLECARIPAKISNSAGLYLCNRLFYSVMHAIAVEELPVRAGFVHLPYLHEQVVSKRQDMPSLSRETMAQAVRIMVQTSLQEC
ncbi:MAG: pyroglutamyl-peptidase I [Caldilineaceae bacterium]|nr:pyroglutamyl-peptidase I [Caldilineaceae bacterium]